MRNYVLFRSRDTHIWEQFAAMTAWTRKGALRKVGIEEGYTYFVLPVRKGALRKVGIEEGCTYFVLPVRWWKWFP